MTETDEPIPFGSDAPEIKQGTCAEHGYHGERTCPQCPSVVNLPKVQTDRVPYGARDVLNEQILEQLDALPTKIDVPADFELARRLIERFANWYLRAYVGVRSNDELNGAWKHDAAAQWEPLRLVSTASHHYLSADNLDEVRAFFAQGEITIVRALMNLVQELGHTLELCDLHGRGLTADMLRVGVRELVEQRRELERKLHEVEGQLQEARGALRAGE